MSKLKTARNMARNVALALEQSYVDRFEGRTAEDRACNSQYMDDYWALVEKSRALVKEIDTFEMNLVLRDFIK